MKIHIECPLCEAQYDMELPPQIEPLLPGVAGPDHHFLTICKQCAMPIQFDGETWSEFPDSEFGKLPPDYQEKMAQISNLIDQKHQKQKDRDLSPPREAEFFLQVTDNPAGWTGAVIVHKGPQQWERLKYLHEAKNNKRITAVLQSIRQLNGIKPSDD